MRRAHLLLLTLLSTSALAGRVEDTLGRTQLTVRSAPHALVHGRGVKAQALEKRLARLGYRQVKQAPTVPGTWQRTANTWSIYRRAHRYDGQNHRALRLDVQIDHGVIAGVRHEDGTAAHAAWLEPEVLSESWKGDRAPRVQVTLDELPEHAWRPLLALEDDRFFKHSGVSGKAIARAALANFKKGGVSQGGSTITQQLVKNRDLTAKRSLDRKASEAVRALAMESEYTKDEILQAYLNTVYYGHVNGVAVYGIGRASEVWFGKPASQLALHEGALLAAMVQGPNAMNPDRHPDRATARRNHALDRMQSLEWATAEQVRVAKSRGLGATARTARRESSRHLLSRVETAVKDDASTRFDKGLGFEVDTTIDPWLQARTTEHARKHVASLRKGYKSLRKAPLHTVVVVMDADSGDILAYVGGDPGNPDGFDRAMRAQRQIGSTIKPLVLLEAYERCGSQPPVRPTTLIADRALDIDGWKPRNYDGKSHGNVSAQTALVRSFNRPIVRLGLHCGPDAIARRVETAGLPLPAAPPLPFLLGSEEATPMQLLTAHSTFANQGKASQPRLVERVGRSNGSRTGGEGHKSTRVAGPGATWLVNQGMQRAVTSGTGRAAKLNDSVAHGKTGTTSGSRDAWFVGHADGVVTVVWVGLDKGKLGLGGGAAAAPLWKRVMEDAVGSVAPVHTARPSSVVACEIDPSTGLRASVLAGTALDKKTTVTTWCLRGALPDRHRPWRDNAPDLIE